MMGWLMNPTDPAASPTRTGLKDSVNPAPDLNALAPFVLPPAYRIWVRSIPGPNFALPDITTARVELRDPYQSGQVLVAEWSGVPSAGSIGLQIGGTPFTLDLAATSSELTRQVNQGLMDLRSPHRVTLERSRRHLVIRFKGPTPFPRVQVSHSQTGGLHYPDGNGPIVLHRSLFYPGAPFAENPPYNPAPEHWPSGPRFRPEQLDAWLEWQHSAPFIEEVTGYVAYVSLHPMGSPSGPNYAYRYYWRLIHTSIGHSAGHQFPVGWNLVALAFDRGTPDGGVPLSQVGWSLDLADQHRIGTNHPVRFRAPILFGWNWDPFVMGLEGSEFEEFPDEITAEPFWY